MRAALAALSLVALPIIGTASPADALSCVGPQLVLEDATTVFTGRIIDTQDHRLHVAVDEVWRGSKVQGDTWLGVELETWWAHSNGRVLPDGWAPKGIWVFVPRNGAVSPCTAWPLADLSAVDVAAYRPERPASPLPGEMAAPAREDEQPIWPYAAGGSALAALLALGLVMRRRQRS